MRKNAERKRFRSGGLGWMAAAVLGVVVGGGWMVAEAQTCGFQPSFCPEIDWETGVRFDQGFAASSSPQCHFVTAISGHQPNQNNSLVPYFINGVTFSGGPSDALPAQVDGGYYIYTPPASGTWHTSWTNGARPGCTPAPPVPARLTINRAGSGTGTTVADPAPTETGGLYAPGTPVAITATANAGSEFAAWTGCASTTNNGRTCHVTMSMDREITAVFNLPGGVGCAFVDALDGPASGRFCGTMAFNQIEYRTSNFNGNTTAAQCWFIAQSPSINVNFNELSRANVRVNGQLVSAIGTNDQVRDRIRNGTDMVDNGYYIYFPSNNLWADINTIVRGTPICAGEVTTLTTATSGSGTGSISVQGNLVGSAGRQVTITATANTGFVAGFEGCTQNGGTVNVVSTTVNTCVISVDHDMTVTATFNPPVYTIRSGWYAWNTVTGNNINPGTTSGSWNTLTTNNVWSQTNSQTAPGPWPTTGTRHAVFAGTNGVTITVNGTGVTVDSMRFESNGYTIARSGANVLTMGNGRIVVDPNRSATISSVLSQPTGAGNVRNLFFTGGGTLTLSGDNAYTGTTTINSGNLIALHNNAFGTGTGAAGAVTVNTGATLTLSGGRTINKPLTVNDGIFLSCSSGNSTWSGVISGGNASSDVTKTGTGNLILTGVNTYPGKITVRAGDLEIGGANGQIGGTTAAVDVETGRNIIFNRSGTTGYSVANVISGEGGLTKQGNNSLTLTGTNIYGGPTTVIAGTLVSQRVSGTVMTVPSASTVTVSSGATFDFSIPAAEALTYNGTINSAGQVRVLGGTLGGSPTITLTGTGVVQVGGTLRTSTFMDITGDNGVQLYQGANGGRIILGGGNISRLQMQPTSTMDFNNFSMAFPTLNLGGGTLNVNGDLLSLIDIMLMDSPSFEMEVASHGNTTNRGRFGAISVDNHVVTRYNTTTGAITFRERIDGKSFAIRYDDAGRRIYLEARKINLEGIDQNHLSITSARFKSPTEVELVVAGITQATAYSTPTPDAPYIDSVGIWYRPARITGNASAAGAHNHRIVFSSLLNTPATYPAANLTDYPPTDLVGNSPTLNNTRVITLTVPAHPNGPFTNGDYEPNPFYHFYIKEFWKLPAEAAGQGLSDGIQVQAFSPGDSIFMRPPEHLVKANELKISGDIQRRTAGAREVYDAELFISNYDGLIDSSSALLRRYKPVVDSVGVWVKANGGMTISNPPASGGILGAENSGFRRIDLRAMKTAGNEFKYTFEDLETLGLINPNDPLRNMDTLYFAVAPRWTRGIARRPEGITARFDSIAAALPSYREYICTVYVLRATNPLLLTADQPDRRNDVVNITVTDPKEPENPVTGTSTVLVEFSVNESMADPFASQPIPVASLDPSFNFALPPQVWFAQETRVVYWRITVTDGGVNITKRGNFTVGRPSPAPLPNFTVVPMDHNRVRLSWDRITIPGANNSLLADGAYILIERSAAEITTPDGAPGRGRFEIVLNAANANLMGDWPNVTRVNDTAIDITGIGAAALTEETEYWFAGAVMDSVASPGGVWNLISNAAVRSAVTPKNDPNLTVRNILAIDKVEYNPNELNFNVTYSLTEFNHDGGKLMYGYHISVNRNDPALPVPPNPSAIEAVFEDEPGKGEPGVFTTWSPGVDMLFDTTWYIILYVYKENDEGTGGAWSAERVIDSIKVGPFNKQPVLVGDNALGSGYANNSRFRVQAYRWPSGADPVFNADITRSSRGGEGLGQDENFVYVSTGYQFLAKTAGALQTPLSFSIKAENIPSGYSMNDVRLYRWEPSGCNGGLEGDGCWHVEFNYKLDGEWLTADSLRTNPSTDYRLMIDKQRPKLLFDDKLQDSGFVRLDTLDFETISASGFSKQFFIQKNNVGNFRSVMYYSAAGNDIPVSQAALDPSPSPAGRIATFTVDGSAVRAMTDLRFGLRAFLVISDGRHTDTVNISRSIKYNKYTNYIPNSAPNRWVPVAAQAGLKNKSLRTVMAPLFEGGEGAGGYDNTKFRIYRYSGSSWVEYSESNNAVFTLEPGRLFWLKTALNEPIEFETDVVSTSLIDSYTVGLPPIQGKNRQWIDFMPPFRFDIRLGDILDSTGRTLISDLEIYRWERFENTYRAIPVFIGGITDQNNPQYDTLIIRGGNDPFTVSNSSSSPITLKVPPILASMSKYRPGVGPAKVAAKQSKSGSEAWYYTVSSRIGANTIGELAAGYNPVEREYGVPPGFGGESVVLVGEKGNLMGHLLSPELANGGRRFKLRFTNSEKQRTTFTFSAQASMFAPENMQVMFVNVNTGELISGGKSEYNISVDGSSYEDVYMVVGSKEYLAKMGAGANMKFVMGNIGVNQAARSARIRYYVPFAGVERIEAAAYDLKGNVVWKNTQKANSGSWNTMEWNSRNSKRGGTAAGLYIVRVKAFNAKGKTVAVANRRVTFTP